MKRSITNLLLLSLEKATDSYVRLEDLLYNPGLYAYHNGWDYSLKKSSLSQALSRLRDKGFIEADKTYLKLTDAGKEFILLSKSESEIDWDGRWRIVIFDIPENKRVLRDLLRSRLKLWGFKPWQKSVWASKKDVTKNLRALISEFGMEDWVLVIESNNVGKPKLPTIV